MIKTSRLILRDFILTDWEAVFSFLSDQEVTQYMHFSSYSQADFKKWFSWCLANDQKEHRVAHNWAIVLQQAEQVIGWLGIGEPSGPAIEGERDFGFALDKLHWGNGYMTEALQAVLAYEFEQLGAKRIYGMCEIKNEASARVMEKAGMHYEGTFYDADFEGNVARRFRYGIHYEEFLSQTNPGEYLRRDNR